MCRFILKRDSLFQLIDEKKKQLDKKRPLPVKSLNSLKEALAVEWTYHSNAIEGNNLTLAETKVVLEGITVVARVCSVGIL
jgi:Fic family protein